MTFDFRYPTITAATEKEQLVQMKTYIHQLVDELKWALNSVEAPQSNVVVVHQKSTGSNGSSAIGLDEDSTQARFNELKPLIIKSAEIIEAYYEAINTRLESLYVAQSDFGTFAEKTSQEIEATSTSTTQQFENMQVIITDIDNNVGSLADTLLDISEEFSYTQRDIVDINSNIKVIGSDVENLSGSISVLDGDIKAVGETVGAIDSELKAVGGNVDKIDTTLKTVEGNVGALDTNLKTVQSNVGTMDSTLKTVEGSVNTLDSNLKTVEGSVNTLDTNLKAVEGNVSTLDTNLKSVETDLKDTKVGIDSTVKQLSDEVGVIDSDLQGVKAGVESGIKDLSDEVGKVDSKIEDAKSAIGSDIDKLKKSLDDLNYILVEVNANIKTGLIDHDDNGIPIYGLEIGQKNTINGVEVFNKFARFSAGRLSFYDNNGTEVAYISDYKLYITHAEVTGTLKLGGYLVDTSKGVTFKWVGRS